MGRSTSQKQVRNPLNPSQTFFAGKETFLGSIYSFLLMSNNNQSFLLSNITQGVVNFPKIDAKSSKPYLIFFAGMETFLGSIYSFLLTSNKNQTFLLSTHRGWSTSQTQVRNPLNPSQTFCRLGNFFGVDVFLPSDEQ